MGGRPPVHHTVTATACHAERKLRREAYMNEYCRPASEILRQGYYRDCDGCTATFYGRWIQGGEYEVQHPEQDLRGKWHNTDAGVVFCRCYARFVGLAKTILRALATVIIIQVIHVISIVYLAKCVTFPDQVEVEDDEDWDDWPSSSRSQRNRRSNIELQNRRTSSDF